MKKFKEWLNRPYTRASFYKEIGVWSIVSLLITAIVYVIIFWDSIAKWSRKKKDQLKKFFKSKTPEERKYQEIKIEEL